MLLGKYQAQRPLSPSHEHYLRAIWDLRNQRGYARMADVARALDVAPATLSVGLRPLEQRGLIAHDEARFLLLTPAGERAAREVTHRFQVLSTFLREVLGVDTATAEGEACLIEHDISPGTTSRFVDFLKLLHEDPELAQLLRKRYTEFRRSCAPSDACSTCGLGCLVPEPR